MELTDGTGRVRGCWRGSSMEEDCLGRGIHVGTGAAAELWRERLDVHGKGVEGVGGTEEVAMLLGRQWDGHGVVVEKKGVQWGLHV